LRRQEGSDTWVGSGITNDIERRDAEHKHNEGSGFTSRYNLKRLVYYDDYSDVNEAIAREKRN